MMNSKKVSIRDICTSVDAPVDAFERYQMPALESSVKQKGQYGETLLVNLPDVGKALAVHPTLLAKYLSWELNTPVKPLAKGQQFQLKGVFDSPTLNTSLRKFIKYYVLCTKCDLPELDYKVNAKKKMAKTKCRSCGYSQVYDAGQDRVWKLMIQVLNS